MLDPVSMRICLSFSSQYQGFALLFLEVCFASFSSLAQVKSLLQSLTKAIVELASFLKFPYDAPLFSSKTIFTAYFYSSPLQRREDSQETVSSKLVCLQSFSFFSISLHALYKSSICPNPSMYIKHFKISPAHIHLSPCSKFNEQNVAPGHDMFSIQFLKFAAKNYKNLPSSSQTLPFRAAPVRSKRAEGLSCFYSTARVTPPSNHHVRTTPTIGCSLQQLNLGVYKAQIHTKKSLQNYVLETAGAHFRWEMSINDDARHGISQILLMSLF